MRRAAAASRGAAATTAAAGPVRRVRVRRGPTLAGAATAAALAAALCAALCASLASCGGPKDPPAYPYVADRPRVLFASAEGLSAARPAAASGATAGALAPMAHNASVLTADARSIVAAVNAFGYARVETAASGGTASDGGRGLEAGGAAARGRTTGGGADGVAYRVINVPLASSFAGLTTAGIWPADSGFILQLYRDPFFAAADDSAARATAAAAGAAAGTRIIEIGRTDGERALPCPSAADGFELFALFPSRGTWLGELRRDDADSVDLAFFEADSPLGRAASRPVGRDVFESALSPLPLWSLQGLEGAALRSALRALGVGQFMTRLRSAEGEDAWYLSGGKAEDAAQAWAWSFGTGRVIVLSQSGALVDAGRGPTRVVELGSPYPGATYSALAAAGGIVAAAWEAGSFPEVVAAGLVIAPLGP
jgi:hypothetical protein